MTSTKSPSARGERGIAFGEFQVDRIAGNLRRGDEEIPLRAKSFALLRYLVENPGRLVTRDELLGAVWPDVAVNPSVVRVSIREVREALGDDPLAPTFIETVGRQGYRFAADAAGAPVAMPSFVGREAELTQLRSLFERCRAQRRQVVFVAGEAGIGKTALIELFVEEIRRAKLARVAQGQCVDLHGATEPYLPILGMLGRLFADDENGEVAAILHRWAPSWLLQMPAVLDAEAAESLHRRVPNPTRDRMLRELADAMEVLSLLERLPTSSERDQTEMACSLDLGASLLAARGYGTPEVEPLFVRARDIALALGQPLVEIVARGGLFTYQVMGGDQRKALELARDLLAMADRFPLPMFVMIGNTTVGSSQYNLGNLLEARRHFELAREAWERGFPRLQLDQKVLFLGLGALTLQLLGDTTAADLAAIA